MSLSVSETETETETLNIQNLSYSETWIVIMLKMREACEATQTAIDAIFKTWDAIRFNAPNYETKIKEAQSLTNTAAIAMWRVVTPIFIIEGVQEEVGKSFETKKPKSNSCLIQTTQNVYYIQKTIKRMETITKNISNTIGEYNLTREQMTRGGAGTNIDEKVFQELNDSIYFIICSSSTTLNKLEAMI